MRTVFLVSALLIALVAGNSALGGGDESGPTVQPAKKVGTVNTGSLDILTQQGTRLSLPVTRDDTVPAGARPLSVEVVGEVQGVALILIDSYASKPAGMSLCQAGQERFLRIVSVAKAPPKETYRVKLESCHDNVELASPGVAWSPEARTLRISWLLGPDGNGSSAERTIRIGADGKPQM